MTTPNVSRIEIELAKTRFKLCKLLRPSNWFTFVRPSSFPNLYESVSYETSGKAGTQRHCVVRISVMKGTYWHRDYTEAEYVKALDANIESDNSMRSWENLFCQISPIEAASLARRKGDEILGKSSSIICECEKYLQRIIGLGSLSTAHAALKGTASPVQTEMESKWISDPSLNYLPEEELTFSVAILGLIVFHEKFEGLKIDGNINLWDPKLMMMIQLLSDMLFRNGYGKRIRIE